MTKSAKTDFSHFGAQFLEQHVEDTREILKRTGLDEMVNMRLSTFLRKIDNELDKREVDR